VFIIHRKRSYLGEKHRVSSAIFSLTAIYTRLYSECTTNNSPSAHFSLLTTTQRQLRQRSVASSSSSYTYKSLYLIRSQPFIDASPRHTSFCPCHAMPCLALPCLALPGLALSYLTHFYDELDIRSCTDTVILPAYICTPPFAKEGSNDEDRPAHSLFHRGNKSVIVGHFGIIVRS